MNRAVQATYLRNENSRGLQGPNIGNFFKEPFSVTYFDQECHIELFEGGSLSCKKILGDGSLGDVQRLSSFHRYEGNIAYFLEVLPEDTFSGRLVFNESPSVSEITLGDVRFMTETQFDADIIRPTSR
jgi:hypothetical protein